MLPTKALELGETIRAARNRKGWSLDKLSEVSGVSATYVSQIETASPASMTGKVRRPSMQKLDALITALEIDRTSTLHLAGWSSDETPQQAPSLNTTQIIARVLRHYQDGSLPDEQQADLDSLSPFFRRLLRHVPNHAPNDEIEIDDGDEAANINSPHTATKE